MSRLAWAFNNHIPTCNDEQGENAGKKCILSQSGECEAENQVAKKSSARKTIQFLRLCFSYIDNLNDIMDWVHGYILRHVIPGSSCCAAILNGIYLPLSLLSWFTLCKQAACFVFQTEISQLHQEMVDLQQTLLREKVSERKRCFEISPHL